MIVLSPSWDTIDPGSLLELVGIRRMTREFGALLRHYWMPAAELIYERKTIPGDNGEPILERITRRPCKCSADVCWWRETTEMDSRSTDGAMRGAREGRFVAARYEEHFCIYDRSTQTFRTRGITDSDPVPVSDAAARIQALVHLPILTPLLPIPVGFQWHVPSENGYMNFTLESETAHGEMSVLFIRRQGRFPLDGFGLMEREGITAYALDRSTVLEDRTRDRLVDSGREVSTVTKLVTSMFRQPPEE